MDVAHQERVARNEAYFRDVNRRIEHAAIKHGRADGDADVYELMCECSDLVCDSMISIELGEYRHLRSEPDRFAVCPEHTVEGAEVVVDRNERFWTVRKIGHAQVVAEQLDEGSALKPVEG